MDRPEIGAALGGYKMSQANSRTARGTGKPFSMDLVEETTTFYCLLGKSMAQWAHLEDSLYFNFQIAISREGKGNLPARAAFFAIQSTEGKISVTDAAVLCRLTEMDASKDDRPKAFRTLWEKLRKRVGDLKLKRNKLAHFQVITDQTEKPSRRVQLRTALFNPNPPIRGKEPTVLYCAELEAIRNSFGVLTLDLDAFREGFAELTGQHTGPLRLTERLQAMLREKTSPEREANH